MSSSKNPADLLRSLGNKVPVVREGLIMEGLEWVTGAGFRAFHAK